jgi:hypothetical protein
MSRRMGRVGQAGTPSVLTPLHSGPAPAADFALFKEARGDDFDPESPRGRFNPRLAIAVVVPEYDWETYGWEGESVAEAVRQRAGGWLLKSDEKLGEPRTVGGSVGRGAEGWIPVVEWTANAIGQGAVDLLIAAAAAQIIRRLRRGDDGAKDQKGPPHFYVSRGMAAALAADDVRTSFADDGPPGSRQSRSRPRSRAFPRRKRVTLESSRRWSCSETQLDGDGTTLWFLPPGRFWVGSRRLFSSGRPCTYLSQAVDLSPSWAWCDRVDSSGSRTRGRALVQMGRWIVAIRSPEEPIPRILRVRERSSCRIAVGEGPSLTLSRLMDVRREAAEGKSRASTASRLARPAAESKPTMT